ncbi:MAG: DNA alkylation repair protein [Candidatus Diapherotrites archaeon]
MNAEQILSKLNSRANPRNVVGMQRFGISGRKMLGISIPFLRSTAKKIEKNHELALELWDSGIHEAKILAAFIDEPARVSEKQLEEWVSEFDSWDVCDQVCSSLFDKTPSAWEKAFEWSFREEEFVKRAGFAMMACLAVHDKQAKNAKFEKCWKRIEAESGDERNFVKKAVNWALRQIGKRNKNLNKKAIARAKRVLKQKSKSAQWIAKDALRELQSSAVQKKLKK